MSVIKSEKTLIIEQKILFVSNLPFADIGNNGKTFQSLFSDFDDSQVAQLFFNNVQPSQKKFFNYFRITDIDILKYIFSFHLLEIIGISQKSYDLNNMSQGKFISQSDLCKKFLRNFLFSKINFTQLGSFKLWIGNFKPTSIFFIGTNYIFSYQILNYLSSFYNLPYFIYFTDDYFLYNKGTNFISKIMHKRFIEKSKKIVERAEELFVISQKMKHEYELFFGKKCTVLINAVDKGCIPVSKHKFEQNIVFRYFGGLHSNRSSSLRYLGECLKKLNKKYEQNFILEVYSLTEPTSKIKSDLSIETILICKPITGDELKNKMTTSDFLVHAESFEPEDINVTMLSISTKIPEYLLSNRCVLAIGPPQLASISIFKHNKLGIVIEDTKSVDVDGERIYEVITNIDLYNSYCRKSELFYDTEFSASKMKKYLKNTLLNI